jgi:nucleoside-diphosphate-sugar epimerase
MKKKILITGCNGFLGEHLVKYFINKFNLIGVDQNKCLYNLLDLKNFNFYKINILDNDGLDKIFVLNNIDVVIHCAAEILDQKNKKTVWKTNKIGTSNLVNICNKYKVKKFIYISTFSIFEKDYNSPILETESSSAKVDYGKSKYEAEKLILNNYKNDYFIFRCPVIIGDKRLDKIAILFELIKNNIDVWLLGGGENKIHFIHVKDLIKAIEKSIDLKESHILNIGSDDVKSLNDVIFYVIKKSGSKSKIRYLPKNLGIYILKILYYFRILTLGPYHQRLLINNIVLNTNKIKKVLDWVPEFSNEKMLYECYNYYINNSHIKDFTTSSKKKPNLFIIKLLKFFQIFILNRK